LAYLRPEKAFCVPPVGRLMALVRRQMTGEHECRLAPINVV
jgi:hypothetical protein